VLDYVQYKLHGRAEFLLYVSEKLDTGIGIITTQARTAYHKGLVNSTSNMQQPEF